MIGLVRDVTSTLSRGAALTAVLMTSSPSFAALGDIDLAFNLVFDTATTVDCGVGFCFQGPVPLDFAGTAVSGSSVTLGPNYTYYAAGDSFWDNAGQGNKTVVANSFGEQVGVPVGTGTVEIGGFIDSFTLDSSYTVQAFVKVLDPGAGYDDILGSRLALSGDGQFSLSADLSAFEGDTALIVQTGFEVVGLNANPADAGTLGSVDLRLGATTAIGGGSSSADVDPVGIPALPLWGLFGLAGLVGLMGLRRKR